MGDERPDATAGPASLSATGRWLILITAFLGWLFAGVLLSTTSQAMRSAALDLLARVDAIDLPRFQELNRLAQRRTRLSEADEIPLRQWRALSQSWFAYYQCAMLFGAATGGLLFGRLGDRFGRARAMAASILCFSLLSAAAAQARAPWQLLVLWYLASLGIGGMWPNGVALVAESWSALSRPLVAGIMGTSANIGIYGMTVLVTAVPITPESWRWMLLLCSAPVVLGLFVLLVVPESPRWLAGQAGTGAAPASTGEVFRPPLLGITLVGIALATIPLIGGWGSANWMVPWAAEVGEAADPPDLQLPGRVGQARALPGIVGSLLGGWVAHIVGRRRSYFLVSVAALACAQYTFWILVPTDAWFLAWVAALGFLSGIYFGWLPLLLPELFSTRVRSTGAGVCFNFGRVLTAVTIFATGALTALFGGDYARIGRITSLTFLVGALVIWLVPDTSRRQLED